MLVVPGKLGSKALTAELRKLAKEAVTITDDGTPLTREQILSKMIWDQALGAEKKVVDEHGNTQVVREKPVAWCQQFLFERMEGRAAAAEPEIEGRITAAEKVSQLARDRVNKLAAVAAGPPRMPKKKETNAQ